MAAPHRAARASRQAPDRGRASRDPDPLEAALRRWEETTLADALQEKPERAEEFVTTSSFPVRRIYTPVDLSKRGHDPASHEGLPGEFPFTRGVHPSLYRGKLWTMRQFAGFGTPEDTNARFHYLLKEGQTGLSTAFDLPTLYGRDSDDPLSHGEVGKCGVNVETLADMERLFQGIPVDEVTTSMTINAPAAIIWAMYLAAGRKSGAPFDSMGGTIQNDILKEFIAQKEWIYPPGPHVRLIVDTIEFGTKHVPKWNTVSISGYHIREAGSTALQELAFTLADGMAYVQASIDRGMKVDDFAPRLSFFFNAHNDLFEELAKYRAARRIWATVMRDKFGAKNPRSWWCRFHSQTAGCSLTVQQPEVNIVRTTVQALAAILGGTQSLHTNSMDEAWALPTEKAVRIALRTQQVLAHESGVANTVDPLGGAYMVETMTDEMVEGAFRYFDRIEALGGVVPAIEKGFFQKEIADSAARYQREIDTKQRIIVGVNDFVIEDEQPIEYLKISEKAEARKIEALHRYRKNRDQRKVQQVLDALRRASEKDVNLMQPILDACVAGATLGEMCNTMKEIFGEWQEPIVY